MAAPVSFSELSISEFVELGRRATDGALANPEIIDRLTPPYDRQALMGARTMLLELTDAVLRQSSHGARQSETGAAVDVARNDFHVDSYLPHAEAAHQLFHNQEDVLNRLGPKASSTGVFQHWAMHVRQFYLTVVTDPQITSAMAEKNISVAELTVAFSGFEHLVATDREWGNGEDSARLFIRDADQLVADFRIWLSAFSELATTRLSNDPEWLEALGIAGR